MKIQFHTLVLAAVLVATFSSGCGRHPSKAGGSANHLETSYVPWGIDEFELFGLTRQELKQKFEGKLFFNSENSDEVMINGFMNGTGFRLSFDDNKIATVQRVFVDGAGCRILGPLLTSKEAALQFSIDGLSERTKLNDDESLKLTTARALLGDLSKK